MGFAPTWDYSWVEAAQNYEEKHDTKLAATKHPVEHYLTLSEPRLTGWYVE